MFIVALLKRPDGSLARTVNVLVPASASVGVPDNAPFPATDNQAGPVSLAKVMTSPFGSLALVAIVAE